MSLHQPVAQNPVHVRDGDARRPAETGGAVDVDGLARTAQPSGALEGRGGVREPEPQIVRVKIVHPGPKVIDPHGLAPAEDRHDVEIKVSHVLVLLQAQHCPDLLVVSEALGVLRRLETAADDEPRVRPRPVQYPGVVHPPVVLVCQTPAHFFLHLGRVVLAEPAARLREDDRQDPPRLAQGTSAMEAVQRSAPRVRRPSGGRPDRLAGHLFPCHVARHHALLILLPLSFLISRGERVFFF